MEQKPITKKQMLWPVSLDKEAGLKSIDFWPASWAIGDEKKTTLTGTDPDDYLRCFPSATKVGTDFHGLAVLNSCIRVHPDKNRQSYFSLKLYADFVAVSVH